MKSLVNGIREAFNRRTKVEHTYKEASHEQRTLVLQNGECASRLLLNQDFALMFNLYRFSVMERLEDATSDADRISNAHFVAGVRDFIGFVEKQEYLGKMALRRAETNEKKG
jgi:hypothetical protein